jgi:hypothetical protein
MLPFLHFRSGWASILALALALPPDLRGQQFQVRGVVADEQTREPIPAADGAPTIPGEFVNSAISGSGGFGMPCKVTVLWMRG